MRAPVTWFPYYGGGKTHHGLSIAQAMMYQRMMTG
ncbi:hypothetical protein BN961_02266 [Afipia felis]|uniref:Uncharacterized protein n=1 Tax=Afipia felis TaxID=1035 RepID=A0A090MRN0_AFIFE|nr:hypothetical protein AfiDRAFT_3055 [Afipia sp. 1NLS2]CEG08847.1 hypothetical protein BN961_02266 [Afipia felis]